VSLVMRQQSSRLAFDSSRTHHSLNCFVNSIHKSTEQNQVAQGNVCKHMTEITQTLYNIFLSHQKERQCSAFSWAPREIIGDLLFKKKPVL